MVKMIMIKKVFFYFWTLVVKVASSSSGRFPRVRNLVQILTVNINHLTRRPIQQMELVLNYWWRSPTKLPAASWPTTQRWSWIPWRRSRGRTSPGRWSPPTRSPASSSAMTLLIKYETQIQRCLLTKRFLLWIIINLLVKNGPDENADADKIGEAVPEKDAQWLHTFYPSSHVF